MDTRSRLAIGPHMVVSTRVVEETSSTWYQTITVHDQYQQRRLFELHKNIRNCQNSPPYKGTLSLTSLTVGQSYP
jgi:predicted 2-oxoglutarate/Fe(II)-dependent dioxygenase YbiX